MKYCIFISFLAILLHFEVRGQDAELDSIKNLVETYMVEDSVRVRLLINLTKYYTSRDLNESLPLIEEAVQISEKINYQEGKGDALNAFGTYYILKGELDKALSKVLEAKSILEKLGSQKGQIQANNNLARIYGVGGKHGKALKINLENIDFVKNDEASPSKAGFHFYAAKTYGELGDYAKSEEYYTAALQISKECNYGIGIAIAEGSLGTTYNQLGNYKKAIEYLNKTRVFSEKYNHTSNIAATYYSLALSYKGLKQFQEAIENNAKSIEIYGELKNFRTLKDSYSEQSIFYEELGNFKKSNEFLKLHYAIKDSLFSEKTVKVVEGLQTKYETEKKEAEITSLSQEASIQALEIGKKNQAIIIGVVVVLFIFTAFFFFSKQRAVSKEKKQTELEQRFLRSQLNPHFISNALVAVQSFMLKNDSEAAALYLAKFSKLMREILENSRKEFIPVEEEINMLKNYLDIHKLRFKESFEYNISIDDNINPEEDTIPPMFVQPFVENSIEHGIINAKGKGVIDLSFVKQDGYISIEVKDNGGGLVHNSEPDSHTSLSSTIIKERMELFNQSLKNKIQLVLGEIKNDKGEIAGTKVELKVPFSYI